MSDKSGILAKLLYDIKNVFPGNNQCYTYVQSPEIGGTSVGKSESTKLVALEDAMEPRLKGGTNSI